MIFLIIAILLLSSFNLYCKIFSSQITSGNDYQEFTLYKGWNLIGISSFDEVSTSELFSNVNYYVVYKWDPIDKRYTLTNVLKPNQGYWVLVLNNVNIRWKKPIEILENREYYYELLELINSANETIYVIMYVMKYDPDDPFDPANDLIRALVNASNRGVNVNVILESEVSTNDEAYWYLKSNGVSVYYDNGSRTHAKIVIIDSRIIIVGSHNWTESALWYNNEVSLIVYSRELANHLISYFNEILEG